MKCVPANVKKQSLVANEQYEIKKDTRMRQSSQAKRWISILFLISGLMLFIGGSGEILVRFIFPQPTTLATDGLLITGIIFVVCSWFCFFSSYYFARRSRMLHNRKNSSMKVYTLG